MRALTSPRGAVAALTAKPHRNFSVQFWCFLQRQAVRMSAAGPSNRGDFLTAGAAVAASAVVLPLGAIADEVTP